MDGVVAASAALGEHVSAMRLIFLMAILFALGGCEREPAVIAPPKKAAAVIEPFLQALQSGNKAKAQTYVANAAFDELDLQFATDHKKLAAAPKLTARYSSHIGSTTNGKGDEVTLVYAAKHGNGWTSATVRAYRYRDEPFKVEYWRVTDRAPMPIARAGFDMEKYAEQQKINRIIFWGLGALAIIALALLVWLLRRKPHLVAAENAPESRRPATTVRD
jgi:hypothetical protein